MRCFRGMKHIERDTDNIIWYVFQAVALQVALCALHIVNLPHHLIDRGDHIFLLAFFFVKGPFSRPSIFFASVTVITLLGVNPIRGVMDANWPRETNFQASTKVFPNSTMAPMATWIIAGSGIHTTNQPYSSVREWFSHEKKKSEEHNNKMNNRKVIVFLLLLIAIVRPCPGLEECYPCEPGSQTIIDCYLVNSTVCCPSGYCLYSSVGCLNCTPGYFQPNYRASVCFPCGPGFYCPGEGSRDAIPCPIGYYCPRGVNEQPIICDIGTVCPTKEMSEGNYCLPGTYCPERGMTTARDCDAGFYCPGGATRIQCAENTYCPKGSSQMRSCFYLYETLDPKQPCHPSVGFYVVVGVLSIVALITVPIILFVRKRAKVSEERKREVTSLIPKASGLLFFKNSFKYIST